MKEIQSRVVTLLRRFREATGCLPEVWSDRERRKSWARATRLSQWILAATILVGVFFVPPAFEAVGDAIFAPKRVGFFRRRVRRHSGAETTTTVLTVLYWIGAVGTSVSLAWLELPKVAGRRSESRLRQGEGPTVLNADKASHGEEAYAQTIITTNPEHQPRGPLPPTDSCPEPRAVSGSRPPKERYVIEGELGRGGMGIVYSARDTVLDRMVALKALPPAYIGAETTATRFRQEARLLARLTHPNIVQVYDFIETDDGLYIAMELVPGENLGDHIEKLGPMTLGPAIELGIRLTDAMEYAHQQGVLHRDFKPQNVLLTSEMVPKITDFGLATAAESPQLTQTGAIMGSPAYMSPEQASGGAVGPTADIYSFGATFFEMLTGRPPYIGGLMQIVLQQASSPPPSISKLVPKLPAELDGFIFSLLAKEPRERLPAMKDVAERLRDLGLAQE